PCACPSTWKIPSACPASKKRTPSPCVDASGRLAQCLVEFDLRHRLGEIALESGCARHIPRGMFRAVGQDDHANPMRARMLLQVVCERLPAVFGLGPTDECDGRMKRRGD